MAPVPMSSKTSLAMSSHSPWNARSIPKVSITSGRTVSSQTPGPPTTSLAFFPALALLSLAIRDSNSTMTQGFDALENSTE